MDGFVFYLAQFLLVKTGYYGRVEALEVTAGLELALHDATNVVQKVVLQADHANAPRPDVVGDEVDLLFGEGVHLVDGRWSLVVGGWSLVLGQIVQSRHYASYCHSVVSCGSGNF